MIGMHLAGDANPIAVRTGEATEATLAYESRATAAATTGTGVHRRLGSWPRRSGQSAAGNAKTLA